MILKLGGLFAILALIFWLWALFDLLTTDKSRVRTLPKLVWVVVVVVLLELGALAWVLLGRPARTSLPAGPSGRRGGDQPPGGGRQPRGPLGPDDDPDFLRSLDR